MINNKNNNEELKLFVRRLNLWNFIYLIYCKPSRGWFDLSGTAVSAGAFVLLLHFLIGSQVLNF